MFPLIPIILGALTGVAISKTTKKYAKGGKIKLDEKNSSDGSAVYPDLSKIKEQVIYEKGGRVSRRKADEIRNKQGIYPEIEISYTPDFDIQKLGKGQYQLTNKITSSKDAFNFYAALWNLELINAQEEMIALLLNQNNVIIGYYNISKGGIAGTVAEASYIVGVAAKSLAKGVILCHNHPSATTRPSEADMNITNKISNALKFINVNLLDSMIIVRNGIDSSGYPEFAYYSFADEGVSY